MRQRYHRLFGAAAAAPLALALLAGLPLFGGTGAARAQAASADAEVRPFDPVAIGSFAGAYLAARTAETDRDTRSAIDLYSRALAFEPDNVELRQRLMIARFIAGEFDEGLPLAEELSGDQSVQRVTALALAVEAFRNGDYETAGTTIAYQGPNDLDRLMSGLLQAWAKFGGGEADAALAMLDEMQGVDWFSVFLNFHGGAIAAAAGELGEARQRYAAVITDQIGGGAAPDTYMRAVMALAVLEAEDGNRQRALDVVSTGDAFSPGYAPLAALRQRIEDGAALPAQIETAAEGAAAVLFSIGAALNREGAEEVVSLYLQFSRTLDPENGNTLVLLGGLAESLDKPEEAIAIYESVPDGSPMRRVAQLQLGLNLADLERKDEAKAHLMSLIEADPEDMRSYLAYGSVLSRAEEYREMAENYDRAVEMIGATPERGHWNVFFQRGIAYERLKEWEKAEPNFLQSLELFPDQPHVLNYLGYSWVDMNMNLEEGMAMIEKAVELRPNDGYIVDSLGWAHYRLGDYEEAVTELERAVELRPGDPIINDHLGDAYWKVGRRLEATFQWNRSLTLDPEDDLAAAIEAKLEDGLSEDDGTPATAEGEERRPPGDPDERS